MALHLLKFKVAAHLLVISSDWSFIVFRQIHLRIFWYEFVLLRSLGLETCLHNFCIASLEPLVLVLYKLLFRLMSSWPGSTLWLPSHFLKTSIGSVGVKHDHFTSRWRFVKWSILQRFTSVYYADSSHLFLCLNLCGRLIRRSPFFSNYAAKLLGLSHRSSVIFFETLID